MPDRAVVRRILAFIGLGLVAGAWLVARPSVVARWEQAALLEFPAGLAVVALLCWLAARPARTREVPEPPWRRHAQVVRPIADPEAAPLESALDAWVETGASPEAAMDVLARAAEPDDARRAELKRRLLAEAADAKSKRKREAILRRALDAAAPAPDTPSSSTHEIGA